MADGGKPARELARSNRRGPKRGGRAQDGEAPEPASVPIWTTKTESDLHRPADGDVAPAVAAAIVTAAAVATASIPAAASIRMLAAATVVMSGAAPAAMTAPLALGSVGDCGKRDSAGGQGKRYRNHDKYLHSFGGRYDNSASLI